MFGYPGLDVFNAPAGSGFEDVRLGQKDGAVPGAVTTSTVSSYAVPGEINLQWQEPADNTNGTGVAQFFLYRGGAYVGQIREPGFVDKAVTAGQQYTYRVDAMDYHGNFSTGQNITITAVQPNQVDPRRVGVHAAGTYWGAMGENVDMRSKNVNYSMPLVKAEGRNGMSIPIGLSYNSQVWRRESGVNWKLGEDVGYGFGWKVLAGSLTPYWSSYYVLDHWTFTDGTGAEYRLDQNTGGVWTSREQIWISYDQNRQRLYFNDGTFWLMDVISHGAEQDAGVRYPSLLQDSNGDGLSSAHDKPSYAQHRVMRS